jgi:3-oxoacyl-[acyl-carrier protein] reductase
MGLTGKVAVVTGGSRGIGQAICVRLASMGATVVINYVSRPEAAEETLKLIEDQGGKAVLEQFDVSSIEDVQEGFKKILADHGRIDILVCNAGITSDGLLATMKEDAWDRVMDINLKGTFHCMKAACRPMMKKRWGRVIIIGSVVGVSGNAGQANYAAAKAGLIGLAKSAARELSSRGITVNVVAPGYIETEMTDALSDEVKENVLKEIPLGVLGEGKDVAAAVAFLSSEDARYVTGHVLHVDGGMCM